MTLIKCCLITLLLFCSIYLQAQEKEPFVHLSSRIYVLPNGVVEVEESIFINTHDKDINFSLYRHLATQYQLNSKTTKDVDIEIEYLKRNDKKVKHHVSENESFIKVNLSDIKSDYVSGGIHEYTLKYRIFGVPELGADDIFFIFDIIPFEFYFPIAWASINVRLPDGIDLVNKKVVMDGASEKDTTKKVTLSDDNLLNIDIRNIDSASSATLSMTIKNDNFFDSVKNELAKRQTESLIYKLKVISPFGLYLIGLFVVWLFFGKDPRPNRQLPDAYLPSAIPSAFAQFFQADHVSSKGFVSALLDLASKGMIKIESKGNDFLISRRNVKKSLVQELSSAYRSVYQNLFKSFNRVSLNKGSYTVYSVFYDFKKDVKSEGLSGLYMKNKAIVVSAGCALIVLCMAIFAGIYKGSVAMIMIMTFVFGIVLPFFSWVVRKAAVNEGKPLLGIIFLVPTSMVLFAAYSVMHNLMFVRGLTHEYSLFVLSAILCVIAFYKFSKSMIILTQKGKDLRQELEYLRLFLSANRPSSDASYSSANASSADVKNRYLQYMPYALALSLEDEWTEKNNIDLVRLADTDGDDGIDKISLDDFNNAIGFDYLDFLVKVKRCCESD